MMERMEFYGYHGVLAEEQKLGQRFIVDIIVYLDLSEAGKTDDLSRTFDYSTAYDVIRQVAEGRPFKLIETLAENIASAILDTYTSINEITVRVTKPHPPVAIHFAGVTVEIHRKRA